MPWVDHLLLRTTNQLSRSSQQLDFPAVGVFKSVCPSCRLIKIFYKRWVTPVVTGKAEDG